MREQLFSKDFHNTLLRNVEKGFRHFIDDLREDFSRGFQSDVVDENFLDQLNDILEDEIFERYSPLKFYWLNLVDNIVYLMQLHEELLIDEEITGEDLLLAEEELYNFWMESELAESFQSFLDNGSPVIEASNGLLPLLENQIISFYVIHLNQHPQTFDDALIYQTIPEIGDTDKNIFIGDAHKIVELSVRPDTYPSLPIISINPKEKQLVIEIEGQPQKFEIKNSPTPHVLDGWKLYILHLNTPQSYELNKKVAAVLADLQKAAPHLLTTIKSFTHTIVPIHDKDIPSYSLQALPGYSLINISHEDNLALLEDIVAENGQHFLNAVLNHDDLFTEDDENCYFNPWDQEFVTAQVLFSETFKKFWSMELFYCLDKAIVENKLDYSKDVSGRIKEQLLVNFLKTEHVRQDFEHAYKNKKINKSAQLLTTSVFKRCFEIKKDFETVMDALNLLAPQKYKDVSTVKAALEKTRQLNQ